MTAKASQNAVWVDVGLRALRDLDGAGAINSTFDAEIAPHLTYWVRLLVSTVAVRADAKGPRAAAVRRSRFGRPGGSAS